MRVEGMNGTISVHTITVPPYNKHLTAFLQKQYIDFTLRILEAL